MDIQVVLCKWSQVIFVEPSFPHHQNDPFPKMHMRTGKILETGSITSQDSLFSSHSLCLPTSPLCAMSKAGKQARWSCSASEAFNELTGCYFGSFVKWLPCLISGIWRFLLNKLRIGESLLILRSHLSLGIEKKKKEKPQDDNRGLGRRDRDGSSKGVMGQY